MPLGSCTLEEGVRGRNFGMGGRGERFLGLEGGYRFAPLEIMARCSAAGLHFRIIPAGFNAPSVSTRTELEFLTGFTCDPFSSKASKTFVPLPFKACGVPICLIVVESPIPTTASFGIKLNILRLASSEFSAKNPLICLE